MNSQQGVDGGSPPGSNRDMFMTALPQTNSTSPGINHNSDSEADEDDFFGDIGYTKLEADFKDARIEDKEFAKLQSAVHRCRELQDTISKLKDDLAQKQEENAAAKSKDTARQKESDKKMDAIRTMEEDAAKINSSTVPLCEAQVKKLEEENDQRKARIAEGPGWTEDQTRQRSSLADAIEHSRSEIIEENARLAGLRSRLEVTETEVEGSGRQKDSLIATLDGLNWKIDDANKQVLAAEQELSEVKRSQGILVESLRVATAELTDLHAECEGEKQMVECCSEEVAALQDEHQKHAHDFNKQANGEEVTLKELRKIRAENKDVAECNTDKQKGVSLLTKERDGLLKDREKASRLRELIDAKAESTDKERSSLQKEVDALNLGIAKLESNAPSVRKEIESLHRDIRKTENELDLIYRKIGVSKKASARVADIITSNENTLRSQQVQLVSIKRAIDELQKMRVKVAAEESHDEERLRRMEEVLQEKQLSLKSLEHSNRLLESTVNQAEEMVRDQRNLLELERKSHNSESKTLIGLRDEVHLAKAAFSSVMTQMKILKDSTSRTDNLVFREHVNHNHVRDESACIETDIIIYNEKSAKLEERRAINEEVINNLGHQIDDEHKQRDQLRQQYRRLKMEKDIIGAHLVAQEAEHRKINDAIDTHGKMNISSEMHYQEIQQELQAAQAHTKCLLEEKQSIQSLLEKQKERSEVLTVLQTDLSRQLDKNSALAVELGKPVNLHRWRCLQERNPNQFTMLENVHALQRQAIAITDKIAARACNVDEKKKVLTALRHDISGQGSVDEFKSQLSGLKSEYHTLNKDVEKQETELQRRIAQAEDVKTEMLKLEKKNE